MNLIRYMKADGSEYLVEAPDGISVMQAGRDSGVPGIGGDCGGEAACATCHVFIDEAWLGRTGNPDPIVEQPLLDTIEGVRQNSRLACQIIVDNNLNGLVVDLTQ